MFGIHKFILEVLISGKGCLKYFQRICAKAEKSKQNPEESLEFFKPFIVKSW